MTDKFEPHPETQPVRPASATPETPETPTPATPAVPPVPPVPPAPPAEPDVPVVAAKRTLRQRLSGTGERLHTTRGLLAAALAALIVGGLGGAVVHAAVDGGDRGDRFQHGPGEMGREMGPGTGRGPGGGMGGQLPGDPRDFDRQAPGVPGQLPESTTPDDDGDDSTATPTPSSSSSS